MSDFRYATVDDDAHRPWPVPAGPWLMRQTWTNLLFAHWRVAPEQLHARLPEGLDLDLFDGDAWVAIVPFQMSNVSLRGLPNLPHLSAFPELNVRTYVTRGGKPGVWFFSLDAARVAAVATARAAIGLPYHWAEMTCDRTGDSVTFSSHRLGSGIRAALDVVYRPDGPEHRAVPGSLEYFLTERYCLYSVWAGQLKRLEIQHPPWLLRRAQASMATNTMLAPSGLRVLSEDPLLHFVERQDVVAWAPEGC